MCTGRASDPEGCKNLEPHGTPRTVLYVSTADQRRIEQLEAQLERLSDAFDARQNPSAADFDRYNREAARLVDQINAVQDRSGDTFVRHAQVCDVGPGQASDAGRWYVCTPVDADGNLIHPPPTRFDQQQECQAAHEAPCVQISTTKSNADGTRSSSGEHWVPQRPSTDAFPGIGVSIQEYRLVSQRPEAAEGPTTPEPRLEAGQYASEMACLHGRELRRRYGTHSALSSLGLEFGADNIGCREVHRGGHSHWVSNIPPVRVNSRRVYLTIAECGVLHGSCVSVTDRYDVDRTTGAITTQDAYVPVPTEWSSYLTAEQCERYHGRCETVEEKQVHAPRGSQWNTKWNTKYIPRVTGRVYTDPTQCGINHGGCIEYRRDGELIYIPYGQSPHSTVKYSYDSDGNLVSERETTYGTDIRAPGRIDPEPDPEPTQFTAPSNAIDVDGTGSPTEYDTGTACMEAGGRTGGKLCGQADNGKWYRLK